MTGRARTTKKTRPLDEARPLEKWVLGLLLAGFLALVVANAWLCDDAYITFRTVDNFVNGYGLTWNVDERVQVYTHPLWMLLMSGLYALTGEIFFTSLLVSIGLSLLAVGLLALVVANSPSKGALAVAVLALSRAFVDYATSGLENPLTHVILVAFIAVYVRRRGTPRRVGLLSLLAALGMVNRLDTALFYGPALLWAVIESGDPRSLLTGALGLLPLAAWELFSLFYYGSLVPNTALAKLNAGLIRPAEIWREGLFYLENSLQVDPITLVTIGVGVALPILARDWRKLPLAGGVVLMVLYVIRVGGDFMSGRFLTAPLCVAVCLLATTSWRPRRFPPWLPRIVVPALLLILGVTAPYTPVRASGARSADDDPNVWVKGRSITDERANYYRNTGLLEAIRRGVELPDHDWAREGREARERGGLVVRGSVGFFGFFAGPDVHVVDILALGDPLLARLPVTDPNWQIGHFGRRPPAGYLETLESGHSMIADPDLAAYYDKLAHIVRGDLWDLGRLREIWRMNTGTYQPLLDAYARYRGASFTQELVITNLTGRPYVCAYVWNNGAAESYLLDSASVEGETYAVRWTLSPSGVQFDGPYEQQVAAIGPLSDTELLNVGVYFAEDAGRAELEMYERRYWFRLDKAASEIKLVLPALSWYNAEAPGGYWQERRIDDVIRVRHD